MAVLELDKKWLIAKPLPEQQFLLQVMSSMSLTENMMSLPQRGLTKKERAKKEREQYDEQDAVDSDFDEVTFIQCFKKH